LSDIKPVMVSFLRHIIPAFCLFGVIDVSAQDVPWLTPSVSLNAVPLTINCIPQVDGQSLREGDYIGIFNEQNRCFGLARWKDTIQFNVIVYGNDGTTDGFNTGEKLALKIWLRDEDCILEKISRVDSDDPLVFSNAVSNRINVLNFERLSVSYPVEDHCINEGILLPEMNYSADDLQFTSISSINLDHTSGAIDPLVSSPGTYLIQLNSGICLTSNRLNMTLKDFPRLSIPLPDTVLCGDEPLALAITGQFSTVQWSTGATTPQVNLTEPATVWFRVTNSEGCGNADTFDIRRIAIKNLEYIVDKADCYRKGRITVGDSQIENGRAPYTFILNSQLEVHEQQELSDVPEGVYTLEVINANGCILRHPQKIIVEKDCLNDVPVFTPNDDGLDDRYFINLEGSVKIFDRNGVLKRRLTAPCYFDGKDESGSPLPMGVYMVISDNGGRVELTIIR
jgi:hypothetical protein